MPDTAATPCVLLVDDDTATQDCIGKIVGDSYSIQTASGVQEVTETYEQGDFDLLIIERKLPDGDGIDLLKQIRRDTDPTPTLIITDQPSVQTAIQTLGSCACDYLCKPFEADELLEKVHNALQSSGLLADNAYLWDALRTRFGFDNVLSKDPVVQGCYVAAARVAASSVTVLIEGETGTGKEYLAKAIHYMSTRSQQDFVPVNCGAIPETLLESELFGHEKGAFTSATSSKAGLCEQADGGTLFLDEISEMSMEMQVKLLRFLQERSFMRLGGVDPIEVDVRIIAATNSNLEDALNDETFREDLYYRLNVVPLHLPPLRERPDDILLFANHFLDRHAEEGPATEYTISVDASMALQRYDWPGNLRELQNVMRRALMMADSGTIEPRHLVFEDSGTPDYLQALSGLTRHAALATETIGPSRPQLTSLEDVEKDHIAHVLGAVENNKTRASEILGIARKTLRSKIDKYGIGQPTA